MLRATLCLCLLSVRVGGALFSCALCSGVFRGRYSRSLVPIFIKMLYNFKHFLLGFLASFRFEPFSSSFHQDMSAAAAAAAQTFGRKLFTDSAPVLDRKTIPTIEREQNNKRADWPVDACVVIHFRFVFFFPFIIIEPKKGGNMTDCCSSYSNTCICRVTLTTISGYLIY